MMRVEESIRRGRGVVVPHALDEVAGVDEVPPGGGEQEVPSLGARIPPQGERTFHVSTWKRKQETRGVSQPSGVAKLRFKTRLTAGGGGANRELFFVLFPVLEHASDRGRVKCNSLGNQDEAIYYYPFSFSCRTRDRGRVKW